MKKVSINSIVRGAVGISLMTFLLFSCSKVEDLLNVPVYVDTDILHNTLTVQFNSADEDWDNRPQNISISILGKDKDKVYSLKVWKMLLPV